MVKVNKNDNVYGVKYGDVVREYLKTAYSDGNTQADVISYGITYKVLRREEVTVFYDADGNTLFDVENKRLEKEYGYVMREDGAVSRSEESNDADKVEEKAADLKKEETDKETGKIPEDKREENSGNDAAVDGVVSTDLMEIKRMAEEKLEKELQNAKDKDFADPIIRFLLKRCAEDTGLAQDIIQEHKTWGKCYEYIFEQAWKQKKNSRSVAVRYDVVYEWAEDYYHKDDKAEEEKKAKEAAEWKKKEEERKKRAAEQKKIDKKNLKQATKKEEKVEEKPVYPSKPKKNPKEMDGQMDLFSMMGM